MITTSGTLLQSDLTEPHPPASAFSQYYSLVEKKTRLQKLKQLAEERVGKAKQIDARSITLPKQFATVVDALGELTPCSEETAKKCKAFLEYRAVPRHKIPKVSLGADGMHALRAASAREAHLLIVEKEILEDSAMIKILNTNVREAAAASWKESQKFGSSIVDDMRNLAKRDVGRYHTEMHTYYKGVQCDCAKQKWCKGLVCVCSCYVGIAIFFYINIVTSSCACAFLCLICVQR